MGCIWEVLEARDLIYLFIHPSIDIFSLCLCCSRHWKAFSINIIPGDTFCHVLVYQCYWRIARCGNINQKNDPDALKWKQIYLILMLQGAQKAVDFLSEYYGVRRMRIILNGRKVGNGDDACYFKNKAYFTKRGLNKRNVLHEFYHHLIETKGLELPERVEEKQANMFASELVKKP